MKQVFVVEIDSSDYVHAVTENDLSNMLTQGFYSARMGNLSIRSIKETTVEQTCGTPESIEEKALSLLKRAAQSLNEYRAELDGDYNDSLATEIEDYIRENTKEKTR